MSIFARSVVLVVIALTSAAVPASAEDIPLNLGENFYDDSNYDGLCVKRTIIQYTVDTATFVAPFLRDGGCEYYGRLLVTATMTRKESSSLYRDDKTPTTVTTTSECPADLDCDFPISMPHPEWEYKTAYTMHWIFQGLDPWPENTIGIDYGAYIGFATWCQSHGFIGQCRGLLGYWTIRTPD